MSGEDILEKVKPYRQILGLNLWDDISAKFMAPNASISSTILPAPTQQILGLNLWNDISTKFMAPDASISSTILSVHKKIPIQLPVREVSVREVPVREVPVHEVPVHEIPFINPSFIINDKHFAEISSWIDHRSSIYEVTKIPYKFKLLLRGSRDGFTRETFYRLCDNLPDTVVVIKVKFTNEIIGGYNPLVWTANNKFKWFATTDIIGCSNRHGPVFGNYFDMMSDNKIWYFHNNAYYQKRIGSDKYDYLIDEFEVFQILKN
ncbi:hypothetical protein C2G38_2173083 [Gigaspora rosea]|uniref:TLDc domain-containing protein n=1 Tax=Gigaspora rosea TaxID=44941 RepID=A0A397VLP1_9GLOM|nr:hypothetical protein C2G38_2173083 [Gigaspora rosea]